MPEAIIITPVKDSADTTRDTIKAVMQSNADIDYYVFNDFSTPVTKELLEKYKAMYGFQLIHLEEITDTPSPNYKLVLQKSQQLAIDANCPLIIIESDVIIKPDTVKQLLTIMKNNDDAGMIGAITVDKKGNYIFPYTFEKRKSNDILDTSHSLSFCCTLLTPKFIKKFSFNHLSEKKDWYDIHISRVSRKLGFRNYLAKGVEVIHLPHSSRPWKNLKYTRPVLYYINKYLKKRDRI